MLFCWLAGESLHHFVVPLPLTREVKPYPPCERGISPFISFFIGFHYAGGMLIQRLGMNVPLPVAVGALSQSLKCHHSDAKGVKPALVQ